MNLAHQSGRSAAWRRGIQQQGKGVAAQETRPAPLAAATFELTSGQVLEDGSGVHCSGGSHAAVGSRAALQQTVDTTHGELEACNVGRGGKG